MATSQIMRPIRLEDYCMKEHIPYRELIGDLITCNGVCDLCYARDLECREAAKAIIAAISNPKVTDLSIDISRRILGSIRIGAIDRTDTEEDN